MPPKLHTASEVAQQIRKSVTWLYRNYRRYEHTRIGRGLFWTDEQVAAIIQACAVPAATHATPASGGTRRTKQPASHTATTNRNGNGLSGFTPRPASARRPRRKASL